MSLRLVKFDDHWRHVFLRTFPTRFTEIRLNNLSCLADSTITFSGGVNAIVGGNGVGKSTLAAAIAQLLAGDPNSVETRYRSRLRGSTLEGIAFSGDEEVNLKVEDQNPETRVSTGEKFTGHYHSLDPSDLASRCLHQIHADQNFDDLLEPLTPLKLTPEELKVASYLVGKEYDEIGIYEISDYVGDEVFPYFEASAGGVSYGSEGMGRGELSLLLSYWTLRDIPSNSILILEEPETHVSPRSQDCLMNIVAKFSDERAIWVIITTHSPTVVRRIPKQHLKLFVRAQGPASCMPNASKFEAALVLGGGVAYRGIVLVEDKSAQQFTLAVLEKLEPEMLRQLEIGIAGSASNLSNLLSSIPLTKSWLKIVGLYDGDLRASINGEGHRWPHGFLPGDLAPELLLISIIELAANLSDDLALELGKTADQVTMALGHSAGSDHHDYFGQFASALNLDIPFVVRGFVRIWLNQPGNEDAARQFIELIRGSIGVD